MSKMCIATLAFLRRNYYFPGIYLIDNDRKTTTGQISIETTKCLPPAPGINVSVGDN